MSQIKKKFIKFGTGTEDVNSRVLPAHFTPTNYTPSQVSSEGTDKTSAHLKGIDDKFATVPAKSVSNNTSLTGGGTLTLGSSLFQTWRVGAASAVSLSTTPFGAGAPTDGTRVLLIGTSNTNTITLSNNDAAKGCILNGSCVLGSYDCIELEYNSTFDRYIEVSRNF